MCSRCTRNSALCFTGLVPVPEGLFLPETQGHTYCRAEMGNGDCPSGLKVLNVQMPRPPHSTVAWPTALLIQVHCACLLFPNRQWDRLSGLIADEVGTEMAWHRLTYATL